MAPSGNNGHKDIWTIPLFLYCGLPRQQQHCVQELNGKDMVGLCCVPALFLCRLISSPASSYSHPDLLATQPHPPTPVLNHQPELFHPHLETTWYHLGTTWTTLGHHNLETFGIPKLGQLRDTFWDNFEPLFGTSLRHLLGQLWDSFDKCFGQL